MKATTEVERDLKWLKVNLKVAIIHEVTDMIIQVQLCRMNQASLEAKLTEYRHKLSNVFRRPFGSKIQCSLLIQSWYEESQSLVEIHKRVATDGMGRETCIIDLLIQQIEATLKGA